MRSTARANAPTAPTATTPGESTCASSTVRTIRRDAAPPSLSTAPTRLLPRPHYRPRRPRLARAGAMFNTWCTTAHTTRVQDAASVRGDRANLLHSRSPAHFFRLASHHRHCHRHRHASTSDRQPQCGRSRCRRHRHCAARRRRRPTRRRRRRRLHLPTCRCPLACSVRAFVLRAKRASSPLAAARRDASTVLLDRTAKKERAPICRVRRALIEARLVQQLRAIVLLAPLAQHA